MSELTALSGVMSAAETAAAAGGAEQNSAAREKDTALDLREKLEQAREKAQERRDSLKLRSSGSQYGDATMTAYARLAQARTQGDVSAAAGYARRQIARFQAALGQDSENAPRIKAAIRQLRKAVGRAGQKKRELQREDLLRARQRRAQKEEELRKASGLGRELGRRKTMRMIREAGYLREAEIDDRQQAQLARARLELQEQFQTVADALKPAAEDAARLYTAGTETAAAPAGSLDIQV